MLQTVDIAGLEVATHRCLHEMVEARILGIDEQPRPVYFYIFAVHRERFAIRTDTAARPLASDPKISFIFGDTVHTLLAPPLRHLLRISKGLKNAVWRSGDEDLRQNHVVVESDLGCCDSVSSLHRLALFHKSLQPFERGAPAFVVAVGLLEVTSKTRVANFYNGAGADTMSAAAVQAMNISRLQFPSDNCFELAHKVGFASLHQPARRINFEILALHVKGSTVRSHAVDRPFPAYAQVEVESVARKTPFCPHH